MAISALYYKYKVKKGNDAHRIHKPYGLAKTESKVGASILSCKPTAAEGWTASHSDFMRSSVLSGDCAIRLYMAFDSGPMELQACISVL